MINITETLPHNAMISETNYGIFFMPLLDRLKLEADWKQKRWAWHVIKLQLQDFWWQNDKILPPYSGAKKWRLFCSSRQVFTWLLMVSGATGKVEKSLKNYRLAVVWNCSLHPCPTRKHNTSGHGKISVRASVALKPNILQKRAKTLALHSPDLIFWKNSVALNRWFSTFLGHLTPSINQNIW